jgi:hypothetical protein
MLFEIPQRAIYILYVVVEKNQPLYVDTFGKKLTECDRKPLIRFLDHFGQVLRVGGQ